MIYDRLLTVYTRDPESGPRQTRLARGDSWMYGEKEVYSKRFYMAMQAGETIDRMAELWRADIRAGQFVVLWDEPETVYRVVQAQHGQDRDGLNITTLSLRREEAQYTLAD